MATGLLTGALFFLASVGASRLFALRLPVFFTVYVLAGFLCGYGIGVASGLRSRAAPFVHTLYPFLDPLFTRVLEGDLRGRGAVEREALRAIRPRLGRKPDPSKDELAGWVAAGLRERLGGVLRVGYALLLVLLLSPVLYYAASVL